MDGRALMTNPVVRKLELFTRLSVDDKAMLNRLASARVRQFNPREDIMREGDAPRDINLFLSGWACRYKQMEDGRRQIIAFFLPGDLCDMNVFILREMDHSISAVTPVTVAEVSRETFDELALSHPRVVQALCWESLVNASIQREWTVNLGQRTAAERIAHLICELFLRLHSIGLARANSCEWPITQIELADTTGMSSVHVSRTINELRSLGLIVLRDRQLTVSDLPGLMRLAMFNSNYLHLQHEGAYLDSN
jgi:CRP-like cAMP-binding protein